MSGLESRAGDPARPNLVLAERMRRLCDRLPIRSAEESLILRPWRRDDLPAMVEMFDTAEMDRRTPLESPFDLAAAERYLRHAEQAITDATMVQVAITEDGEVPMGDLLTFAHRDGDALELAYGVGAAYRGRSLTVRAVRAILAPAAEAGFVTAALLIAANNAPSEHVARRTGFRLVDTPLVRKQRKGMVLDLCTWMRPLP